MFTRFAREVRNHPAACAAIMRTDRPGLLPYVLDAETTRLLREDPVVVIQSMNYPAQPVGKPPPEDTTPLEVSPIRTGHDTLAEAFGEKVYLRVRGGAVECPGCGYWGVLQGTSFRCEKKCRLSGEDYLFLFEVSKCWASVDVEALLASGLAKFYLPRSWNEGRSWVRREELCEKYAAYKAEKETACSVNRETPR